MKKLRPLQQQQRPGKEAPLIPQSLTAPIEYPPEGKLFGKVAIISGADSGIGKAVALLFAKEGASIAFCYLSETEDAKDTKSKVEAYGRTCMMRKTDLSQENNCKTFIEEVSDNFGQIDILINNAALHWEAEAIVDITTEQFDRTFKNNMYSYFWMTKYAMPFLKSGASIVNTTSVTAYRGSDHLMDYAATKGAIVAWTRSLAQNLASKNIRVNAVAPGPIWTPLIASTFDEKHNATFGSEQPMGRAGMPYEVAPSFLFLASEDSSYITGQILHPNGGESINA